MEKLTGMGRPNIPPASRSNGRRRASDYALGAARIEAEVAARPGDSLNNADLRLAEGWREFAFEPVPDSLLQIGAGGELVPASHDGAGLELRNTVESPHYVTADASRERLDLAQRAGALELGLDAAETLAARNSLEKMLAHQLAATHASSMKLTEQLNRCVEKMDVLNPEVRERANVQGSRLAGAIARINTSFQQGLVTLQRLRTGGQQVVTVQHVEVRDGGQAVVAGSLGRRSRKRKARGTADGY
jgi:hypothetical protein